MSRGFSAAVLAVLLCVAALVPTTAQAVAPPLPETRWTPRVVDPYPDQMPAAGIGGAYLPASPAGFLTLPCLESCHFVSSIFDHCSANYASDGRICRFDGTVAVAANGIDYSVGYAQTPGGKDFLYYDGHDGWDLGIFYEPVLAAADGVITLADWDKPACHGCGFGRGIRIDHRNGFDTLYGHLWRIDVEAGQAVRRGQVIGISGATGAVSGEHLHFSLYRHGTFVGVDPYGWTGPGPDPWTPDAGNLWLAGVAASPAVQLPRVTASAAVVGEPGSTEIQVSWGSPGDRVRYSVLAYVDEAPGVPVYGPGPATSLRYPGSAGHSYWFSVTVGTALGFTDGGATGTLSLITGATDPGS